MWKTPEQAFPQPLLMANMANTSCDAVTPLFSCPGPAPSGLLVTTGYFTGGNIEPLPLQLVRVGDGLVQAQLPINHQYGSLLGDV